MNSDPRVSGWNWSKTEDDGMMERFVGDHYSRDHDGHCEMIENKKHEANRVVQVLKLDGSQLVMDFGAGPGYIARHVSLHSKKLYCVDVSETFLNEARYYNRNDEKIEFLKVDFAQFDVLPKVDRIYCLAVFIHFSIYDIFIHLSGLYDKLLPDGQLWFDTLSDEYIDFKSDKWASVIEKLMKDPAETFINIKYNNTKIVEKMVKSTGFNIISSYDDNGHSFFHVAKPEKGR